LAHLTIGATKANALLSQLVMIDMQVKLAPAMPKDAMQSIVKNCGILVQAANLLSVPTILTEQYPQGLGETMPEITQHLANNKPITKTVFSAYGEPKFKQQLQRDKSQMILAGMETHICVLQTALDLIQAGKTVFVVEDAVISRSNANQISANKANAIARMRDAGCIITNTESVLFEWIGDAKHEAAKAIFNLIK
jgi:nicotinamidase-related amidase